MKVRKKRLPSKEQNWEQHILLLFPYVNFASAVDLRDIYINLKCVKSTETLLNKAFIQAVLTGLFII